MFLISARTEWSRSRDSRDHVSLLYDCVALHLFLWVDDGNVLTRVICRYQTMAKMIGLLSVCPPCKDGVSVWKMHMLLC